ncbi:hypothetical protein ACLMAL_34650 [Nocardia sp. CWNU-33]|uniref:hypothetical protein n=1 Tax=Nocardia sp. CWNU-33 TaxID=3392117 RepID=UPI00398E8577
MSARFELSFSAVRDGRSQRAPAAPDAAVSGVPLLAAGALASGDSTERHVLGRHGMRVTGQG